MAPSITIEPLFQRRLRRKPPDMQGAIARTIKRLKDDPRYPGLNVHRVKGRSGVWEAYIDGANRLTFHYDDSGGIVLRNHCNHDIVSRSP